MQKKITYIFGINDLSSEKMDWLLKLKKSTDERAIYVDIHNNKLMIRDIKEDILYNAKIKLTDEGIKFSNFTVGKKKKSGQSVENIMSLLPGFIVECINNFNFVEGLYFFKVFHPLKLKLVEGDEIQLDIFLITINTQTYLLIEPINYNEPEKNIMLDLHEIKPCEYIIMDRSQKELENEIANTTSKLKKIHKITPLFCMVYNRVPNRYKEGLYSFAKNHYIEYSNKKYDEIMPKPIELSETSIFDLLVDYLKLEESTISCINNYFIDSDEDAPNDLLSMSDSIRFKQNYGVEKIISPYYNISIYNSQDQYDEMFLRNTFEGLLIRNVFDTYKKIYDSNEMNPHKISQQLGINKVLAYEDLSPMLYEFYEKIKSLKQFSRLEEKLELKYKYSKSLYDEQMIVYQRKYNRVILLISICSLFIAFASFYIAYRT